MLVLQHMLAFFLSFLELYKTTSWKKEAMMSFSLKFWITQICIGMLIVIFSKPVYANEQFYNLNLVYSHITNIYLTLSEDMQRQIDCLARNIYWEANGEPFEGKVAVAQVTMNRLESGRYGKDICQVVYYRQRIRNMTACQFTWTCQNKARINISTRQSFKEIREIAVKVYFENYRLQHLTKAMYFHNLSVRPSWMHHKTRVARIGHHIFYRD